MEPTILKLSKGKRINVTKKNSYERILTHEYSHFSEDQIRYLEYGGEKQIRNLPLDLKEESVTQGRESHKVKTKKKITTYLQKLKK